jgi:chemotaxis protein CheZ
MVNPWLRERRMQQCPRRVHERDFKRCILERRQAWGRDVPVQRKVFRIEESAHLRARESTAGEAGSPAFVSELKALRALIAPRAEISREDMERAQAQIAQAQAYKRELDLIYTAIKRTRQEMGAPDERVLQTGEIGRVSRELDAIVGDTEQATQTILKATEDIDQAANMLMALLKSDHEQGLAGDIQERAVQLYQACNFQDLTGQRVGKVVATLKFVEDHVARLLEIWSALEQFKPLVLSESADEAKRFLNGPKLQGDRGHSSQREIDSMFG